MKSKAQIAIFVVVAIVLVAGIALIFLVTRPPEIRITPEENPQAFIEGCLADSLVEAEDAVFASNGFPNENITNFIVYQGERVPYLCKASQFYIPCTPQEPIFVGKIREGIEESIEKDSTTCFTALVSDLERRGEVTEGTMSLEINLETKSIEANIDKEIVFRREDKIQSFDTFKAEIASPLYDLAALAQTIVNFESTFCEFDELDWMRNNPETSIKVFETSDQTKVYTLINRVTEKELKFAVKSCPLPAGI